MAIDARRALRHGAEDLSTKRGVIVYVLFAVFSILSLPLHQTLTREVSEWIIATADVSADQLATPATPLAVDISTVMLAGGLVGIFLIAEALRLLAVRSFASTSMEAIPMDEVTAGGVSTFVVLLVASVLVQVAVYGGLLVFIIPGIIAAVLTLFVRQAILLDDDGIVGSFRTSISAAVNNVAQVLLILVALILLSLLLGIPTLVLDPNSFASPLLGALLSTITTVYGIAVVTRAYQQLDDDASEALGPDDLEAESLDADGPTA